MNEHDATAGSCSSTWSSLSSNSPKASSGEYTSTSGSSSSTPKMNGRHSLAATMNAVPTTTTTAANSVVAALRNNAVYKNQRTASLAHGVVVANSPSMVSFGKGQINTKSQEEDDSKSAGTKRKLRMSGVTAAENQATRARRICGSDIKQYDNPRELIDVPKKEKKDTLGSAARPGPFSYQSVASPQLVSLNAQSPSDFAFAFAFAGRSESSSEAALMTELVAAVGKTGGTGGPAGVMNPQNNPFEQLMSMGFLSKTTQGSSISPMITAGPLNRSDTNQSQSQGNRHANGVGTKRTSAPAAHVGATSQLDCTINTSQGLAVDSAPNSSMAVANEAAGLLNLLQAASNQPLNPSNAVTQAPLHHDQPQPQQQQTLSGTRTAASAPSAVQMAESTSNVTFIQEDVHGRATQTTIPSVLQMAESTSNATLSDQDLLLGGLFNMLTDEKVPRTSRDLMIQALRNSVDAATTNPQTFCQRSQSPVSPVLGSTSPQQQSTSRNPIPDKATMLASPNAPDDDKQQQQPNVNMANQPGWLNNNRRTRPTGQYQKGPQPQQHQQQNVPSFEPSQELINILVEAAIFRPHVLKEALKYLASSVSSTTTFH